MEERCFGLFCQSSCDIGKSGGNACDEAVFCNVEFRCVVRASASDFRIIDAGEEEDARICRFRNGEGSVAIHIGQSGSSASLPRASVTDFLARSTHSFVLTVTGKYWSSTISAVRPWSSAMPFVTLRKVSRKARPSSFFVQRAVPANINSSGMIFGSWPACTHPKEYVRLSDGSTARMR